jgi:hypothetical protein
MEQLTEEQRELNNVELQHLISSVFTIMVMKSTRPEIKACSTHDKKQQEITFLQQVQARSGTNSASCPVSAGDSCLRVKR